MGDGIIPMRYRKAQMTELPETWQESLTPIYLRYFNGGADGLILSGPNGIGKTYGACALLNTLYADGKIRRPPAYVEAAEITGLWNEWDSYREQQWRDTLLTAGFLIVDDLGKEDRSTPARADVNVMRIGQMLRTRSQRRLPTVVTTNVDVDHFEETYGPSITSLLGEMMIVELSGPDRRHL